MAAADGKPVLDLVVGENGPEGRAPVDCRLALIGYAPVHQGLALLGRAHRTPFLGGETHFLSARGMHAFRAAGFELGDQAFYRHGLVGIEVIVAAEHLQERPLGPFVIGRVAGAHFPVPVI